MLLKITDGQALDERKLMDVYAESNLETRTFSARRSRTRRRPSA